MCRLNACCSADGSKNSKISAQLLIQAVVLIAGALESHGLSRLVSGVIVLMSTAYTERPKAHCELARQQSIMSLADKQFVVSRCRCP